MSCLSDLWNWSDLEEDVFFREYLSFAQQWLSDLYEKKVITYPSPSIETQSFVRTEQSWSHKLIHTNEYTQTNAQKRIHTNVFEWAGILEIHTVLQINDFFHPLFLSPAVLCVYTMGSDVVCYSERSHCQNKPRLNLSCLPLVWGWTQSPSSALVSLSDGPDLSTPP